MEKEDNEKLSFTSNIDSSSFIGVSVDGVTIDESMYEKAKTTARKIVLKQEFLVTLTEGKHTLSIASSHGNAQTEFTIEAHSQKYVNRNYFDFVVALYSSRTHCRRLYRRADLSFIKCAKAQKQLAHAKSRAF